MFNCGICNKQSAPREKAFRVVTESRTVTYPHIRNAHVFRARDGGIKIKDDPGGTGAETVKEVLAHQKCAIAVKYNDDGSAKAPMKANE